MQFLLVAYDGTDAEAPARRQKVRADHLTNMLKLKDTGNYILGGAMLNEQGGMIGSTIVVDFPDLSGVDKWLASEPYIIGKVWDKIDVHPFRVAGVAAENVKKP